MPNIREIYDLSDPAFIDNIYSGMLGAGGADIHVSGEVVINSIKIGDDLYEIGDFFVNSKGDILDVK